MEGLVLFSCRSRSAAQSYTKQQLVMMSAQVLASMLQLLFGPKPGRFAQRGLCMCWHPACLGSSTTGHCVPCAFMVLGVLVLLSFLKRCSTMHKTTVSDDVCTGPGRYATSIFWTQTWQICEYWFMSVVASSMPGAIRYRPLRPLCFHDPRGLVVH